MKKGPWSARVVIRYALLQVPATVLLILLLLMVRRWVELPTWFICGLIALWIAKDIALFPFLWRAYDPDSAAPAHSIEGARGVAVDHLDPSGYVRVRAELWKAEVLEGEPSIEPGAPVRVCGVNGLTLLVRPDSEE
ncbi:MAG: NfeD family protein [Syntrophobacteria bacterium]